MTNKLLETLTLAEEASNAAKQFIQNGVELGYILMPDAETPDSAHETLPLIIKAIAAIREQKAELGKQAEQEPLVRFCPGCGSIGEVDSKYRDCCPDGIKARLVPSRFAEECQGLFNLAIGNVAPVREPVKWTDAALLNLMNSVGDGPFGEEDLAVTRRFMERAEEIRQELYAAPVEPVKQTDSIADIKGCGA